MTDGSGLPNNKWKRFGRWGPLVAVVAAICVGAANLDGTISLAERAGRAVGIVEPADPTATRSTPAAEEPSDTQGPPTSPPTAMETTPTETSPVVETTRPDDETSPVGETSPTQTPGGDETTTPAPPGNTFGWYYLADLSPVSTAMGRNCTGGCTGFRSGPGSLGQVYAQSYLMRVGRRGSLSTSVWNALKACTKFEATVGLDDLSASTTARFTITRDGSSPVTVATVQTGQPKTVTFDLKGVYRFTLGSNLTRAESNDQRAVWGDARVYCTEAVKPTES